MISTVKWVSQGASLRTPLRSELVDLYNPDIDVAVDDSSNFLELKENEKKKKKLNGNKNEHRKKKDKDTSSELDDEDSKIIKKYGLDEYESEPTFGEFDLTLSQYVDKSKVANEKRDGEESISSDLWSSELDEIKIESTDNLILIPNISEDVSSLDVYVREKNGDIYIHHNIFLDGLATCIEVVTNETISELYMPKKETPSKNYVAVGNSDSMIDIWNLDIIDAVCPVLVLGPQKNKHTSSVKIKKNVHTGTITSMSTSKCYPNLLLSGSTDSTIKLWDISGDTRKAVTSYGHHKNDVQSISWHPNDSTVVLSGGMDKCCYAFDTRTSVSAMKFKTKYSVECAKWDPFDDYKFFVGQESGLVLLYDVRNNSKPIITLDAHYGAVTSIEVCPLTRGLISTGSVDGTIKLWKFSDNSACFLSSKSPKIGKILSMEFNPNRPTVLLAGGNKSMFVTWDISSTQAFRENFADISDSIEMSETPFKKISCYNFSKPNNSDVSDDDSSVLSDDDNSNISED